MNEEILNKELEQTKSIIRMLDLIHRGEHESLSSKDFLAETVYHPPRNSWLQVWRTRSTIPWPM